MFDDADYALKDVRGQITTASIVAEVATSTEQRMEEHAMGVDRGALTICSFDGSDPYADLTQEQVDFMHLQLGLRPPGWPALVAEAEAEPEPAGAEPD